MDKFLKGLDNNKMNIREEISSLVYKTLITKGIFPIYIEIYENRFRCGDSFWKFLGNKFMSEELIPWVIIKIIFN